jgi:hypothetical protein
MKALRIFIFVLGICNYCWGQTTSDSIISRNVDSLICINPDSIEKVTNEQTLYIGFLAEQYIKNGKKYKCFHGKNKITNEFTSSEEAKKEFRKCVNHRKTAFYSLGGIYAFAFVAVITVQPAFLLAALGLDVVGVTEYFIGMSHLQKAVWIQNNHLILNTIKK